MDALGSQQTAVAMVTEQDQFLTLSRETLQTSISPDGQPDDLYTNEKHKQPHVQIPTSWEPSPQTVNISIVVVYFDKYCVVVKKKK